MAAAAKLQSTIVFPPPPAETGTTIMAVQFKDGVVIGADSRSSAGIMIGNRVTDKLTEITPRIFCCRSGSVADTQAITDIVRYQLEVYEQEHQRLAPVEIAAQVFRDMCYRYRDDLSAGIIIAGWDPVHGGQCFSVPLGGMIVRQTVALGGSGSTFIYGFVDANYRREMSQSECEEFVKKSVALAIQRDGSSGGVIRLGIITKGGIERKLFIGSEIPKFSDDG